ncbi:MAG: energy transducer TonB [Candidatus Methylomirabilia bacterium]
MFPKPDSTPAPSRVPPERGEPVIALSPPESDIPPSLPSTPGGGRGIFRQGRRGIAGKAIPLNTRDTRYTDYFEKVRREIKANWIYPREAGERGIGGKLVIEFVIAKSGELDLIDLQRSSGVSVLDLYALNAVKLAQPFPPIPDSVAKGMLPILGIFTYQIVSADLLNQYIR